MELLLSRPSYLGTSVIWTTKPEAKNVKGCQLNEVKDSINVEMKLRIILELVKDKSQGENGKINNKQNREKDKETCDFVHANAKQFVKWCCVVWKPQLNCIIKFTGFLKLILCRSLCVCVCVSAPEAINNQWSDIDSIRLVKQVL